MTKSISCMDSVHSSVHASMTYLKNINIPVFSSILPPKSIKLWRKFLLGVITELIFHILWNPKSRKYSQGTPSCSKTDELIPESHMLSL
jgi:hypothetical protein